MFKHKKFIIGGVIVILAALILGYVGFMGTGTYYYNVSEFLNKESTLAGQTVRVSGIVEPGAIKTGLTWTFTLQDVAVQSDTINVSFSGFVPDSFKVGQQAVVEGKFDAATGVIEGTSVVVKCSSKAQPGT
jgi:cytochrome c-type biogenesis protein CcmE